MDRDYSEVEDLISMIRDAAKRNTVNVDAEAKIKFAFAVLEEVEARADVGGPRFVAEPKTTMREVLETARAKVKEGEE